MTESDEIIETVKLTFRKDLESVSLIRTIESISLAAKGNSYTLYGLILEALYVFLHAGKDAEEIVEYAENSLGLSEDDAFGMLKTVMHVRSVLQSTSRNQEKATEILNAEPGSDTEVTKMAISSCMNTANEFNVPWEKDFYESLTS